MRKFLSAAVVVFVLSMRVVMQSGVSLDSFLKLKVLHDTRIEVENEFGNGSVKNNPYFITYKRANLLISVDYSMGDCTSRVPIWNVPEWTIVEVSYKFLGDSPPVRSLIDGGPRFVPRIDGDVLNHISYEDEENGISVLVDKDSNKVLNISIRPSSADAKKLECTTSK